MIDHLTDNVIGKYTQWEQNCGDVMSTCWLKLNSYVRLNTKFFPNPTPQGLRGPQTKVSTYSF